MFERFPVLFFPHIRLRAEQFRGLDDSIFERQVLKSMQGVVVDENADRSLDWKEMCGM